MRRVVLGVFAVVAFAGLLTTMSCDRKYVFRVLSINKGATVVVDVGDYYLYTDPTDPEAEPEQREALSGASTAVELQYVDIGTGLPTYTPLQLFVHEVEIKYALITGEAPGQTETKVPVSFVVKSDPTGDETFKGNVDIAPVWWVEESGYSPNGDPNEFETYAVLEAEVTFTGVDSLVNPERLIGATGTALLSVGDYYDDPDRIGQ